MSRELERQKSRDKIVDSVRDLYSAKITLPLGNPNLKLVHTNQMLFTQLTEEEFELANFADITRNMNSSYNRFGGYVLNRWYIETSTIDNDGTKGTITLDVNPFPSSLLNFKESRTSFMDAYNQALTSNTNNNTSSSNKTTSVKSVATNYKLKKVKGLSKSDNDFLQKIVKQALKLKNNPKDLLKQAKAVFLYYRDNHIYAGYSGISNRGFTALWKDKSHNCGDGAKTIKYLLECLGLNPSIQNGHNHYWIKVKINGKYYYCDQAGAPGKHNTRVLGPKYNNSTVWQG